MRKTRHRRHDTGGGAAAGAHAADLHGHPRHWRENGAAVRPPGQTAGDERLARGTGAVAAGAGGRQTLRPRRRR